MSERFNAIKECFAKVPEFQDVILSSTPMLFVAILCGIGLGNIVKKMVLGK